MKKTMQLIIFLIIIIAGLYIGNHIANTNSNYNNNSILQVKQKDFNFGKIKRETVYHEFVLRNIGKDELLLKEVKPYCGCTAIEYPEEPILPGDSGLIKVNFVPYDFGIFNKKIEIITNSLKTPIIYLSVRGQVAS
ncbi:MAG: DUF1573 domain-containing protein [Hyphomicrobiales bacterium]